MNAKLFDKLLASTKQALAHAKGTKRLTTTRRKKKVQRGK